MMRWLLLVAAGITLASMGCTPKNSELDRESLLAKTRSYNVLVVLVDAAAAGHFGFLGYDRPTTPHFDHLASESIVFEQAHAQASGTALSMYSLFTSHYPLFQAVPELSGDDAVFLDTRQLTLAEALGQRFGHRLLISTNPFVTERLGYAQGMTEVMEDWTPPKLEVDTDCPRYADRVSGPALRWIRRHHDAGYFAYLHYLEPHAPYLPPEPHRSALARQPSQPELGTMRSLRRQGNRPLPIESRNAIIDLYDGNLAYVDAHIGALVDSLRTGGHWERTIFVLLSDHGEGFWQHGTKGHGGIPYQELVHVPLLLRIPGVPSLAGRRIETPVELVDLMPTLLELVGLPIDELSLRGRSWLPLLLDPGNQDERLIHMRSNRTHRPVYGMRQGRWKWLLFVEENRQELYDLERDPREQQDLVRSGEASTELLDRFGARLREWLQSGSDGLQSSTRLDASELDQDMIESLRSLGYID